MMILKKFIPDAVNLKPIGGYVMNIGKQLMFVENTFLAKTRMALFFLLIFSCLITPQAAFSSPRPSHPVNTELNQLKKQINATGDKKKTYKALRKYLKKHQLPTKFLEGETEWTGRPLQMKILGDFAVISTQGQYNREGFVLIIDSHNKLVLKDDAPYYKGIVAVKSVHNPKATPQSLFIAKYITITGTGTFGNSLRIYAFDKGRVYVALDKPQYEHNSGWGAFEADTVIFTQRNDYVVRKGIYGIQTSGVVSMEYGKKTIDRFLPNERYVWNPSRKKFFQTEGRITRNDYLLTSIYGDFGKPTGGWFKKPKAIKNKIVIPKKGLPEKFKEERFDGENGRLN